VLRIEKTIRNRTLLALRGIQSEGFVPAAVSNRHIHLSRNAVDTLFGSGYTLTRYRELSQPGQYACAEYVTVQGPKESLRLRVLGPERGEVQVELSVTDALQAGIEPVARLSGDLDGTPGATLIGPAGQLRIERGIIVALRHLHLSSEQARVYGLKNGDIIRLQSDGARGVILGNVAVRVGPGHEMEVHLDFDEANCAMIRNGDLLKILGFQSEER